MRSLQFQVLREQLGPGELDAAARVCKAWSVQLAHDVVHVEMCMPGSYEQLLCQLEQLGSRFKKVHSWHLWLPAGSDWAAVDELRLLWLLSRCTRVIFFIVACYPVLVHGDSHFRKGVR